MFRDFDQFVAPLTVLVLVWAISVHQIRKGLKTGELTYWLRGGGSDGNTDDRSTGTCRRAEEPVTFWTLFIFYLLVALGAPLAIGCALSTRFHP